MATGARAIAQALHDLDVRVLFGIVGIPVIQIAEEAIALGIRFIGFRNEQAAGYAATAYGYLTGRPGVCLVVGGPGVLHAMAGIGNSSANAFPLLLLAGSVESHVISKGGFQELDAISLLTPHVKLALRASEISSIPLVFRETFRSSFYGRPGTSFIDLPADLITAPVKEKPAGLKRIEGAPKPAANASRIKQAASLLRQAKAPLIVIGKGAAYAQAEKEIRKLVDSSRVPFLPTPMGKGVVPDSHPLNTSAARSTALKQADVILVLGARLNWILHYGEPPKWNKDAKFIQVDISSEEIGRNAGQSEYGIVGDVKVVTEQLTQELGGWSWSPTSFASSLKAVKEKNETAAAAKAKDAKLPLSYEHTFTVIKNTLNSLSSPADGEVVYVSEGANTMDKSRSIFTVEHPRLRLDAGTYATMGVGLGYAIAAHAAYNAPNAEGSAGTAAHKKIVAIEGDSAFGFSAMEVETMARYGMDILIFVINNGGIYHGDSDSADEWLALQKASLDASTNGLRSTSLGWETRYEQLATACGGLGFFVRTPEELRKATEEGFRAKVPVIINVVITAGKGTKLEFGWQSSSKKADSKL